jgi:hypothetical protein
VDAALAGLEVLATAVTVAPALVRFFAALRPDFPILSVRRNPGLLDLLPQIRALKSAVKRAASGAGSAARLVSYSP